MKVDVNKDLCIGCGACVSICPDVFDMGDDGLAYVKNESKEVPVEHEESAQEALESCPTNAIVEL